GLKNRDVNVCQRDLAAPAILLSGRIDQSALGTFLSVHEPAAIETKLNCDARPSFDELPVASLTLELALIDYHFAARQNGFNNAANGTTFIGAIVDIHVVGLRADCLVSVRVKDHDVGIGANRDSSFFRKHPEHLRCSC